MLKVSWEQRGHWYQLVASDGQLYLIFRFAENESQTGKALAARELSGEGVRKIYGKYHGKGEGTGANDFNGC